MCPACVLLSITLQIKSTVSKVGNIDNGYYGHVCFALVVEVVIVYV